MKFFSLDTSKITEHLRRNMALMVAQTVYKKRKITSFEKKKQSTIFKSSLDIMKLPFNFLSLLILFVLSVFEDIFPNSFFLSLTNEKLSQTFKILLNFQPSYLFSYSFRSNYCRTDCGKYFSQKKLDYYPFNKEF